jgi:hypothetical protein
MLTEAAVKDEVIALHAFIEAWFRGTAPKTPSAFERLSNAWSSNFRLVDPKGRVHLAEELLAQTYEQYGAFPEIRIEIRATQVAPPVNLNVLVVTYEEWHCDGNNVEGRFCSATLADQKTMNAAPAWVHIHESGLPAPSAA